MKIDPYNHKERYLEWKEEATKTGIRDVGTYNSDLILKYLNDMEKGINISMVSVKGGRSHMRLCSLRDRLRFFSLKFKELYDLDRITNVSEEQVIGFFADMKSGVISRKDGKQFKSTDTAVKIFKAFWHWYQKMSKKQGLEVPDITLDLDTRAEKPDWVYLTEEEIKKLCDNVKPDYKTLIMFLFDTGIRAPTELMNIKVSDLYSECKEVNIREEASKTFGRRIKLMLCSHMVKEHIKNNKLTKEDYLFPISPGRTNEYLKRTAQRVFGEGKTLAGQKYSELTMYDFRHNSCCYWLPRYKSESALKYRFGWKKSEKIHYYSELLGMKDTISEDDLLIDTTKTEIEKRLAQSEKERGIMEEKIKTMELQMINILELVKQLEITHKIA